MRPLYMLVVVMVSMSACRGSFTSQLERVAKDWCLTIRASQVIPVYPLTEDLQPGDVFLVLTPIQLQAREYEDRGFLPLDMHLTRLNDLDFKAFYTQHFAIRDGQRVPRFWREEIDCPIPDVDDQNDGGHDADDAGHIFCTNWHLAPHAAFPSYTFDVRRAGAVAAALPIQGVPVGLSMLRTTEARGSVTIADAYAYGVAFDNLIEPLQSWVAKPLIRQMLSDLHEQGSRLQRDVFLRVVYRVYLTGRLVVSVTDASATGVSAHAGAGQAVDLAQLQGADAADQYCEFLRTLSNLVSRSLPGGQIDFLWVTNRSVTLSERFRRPLVIGYLGFDFPIERDGLLGAPVASIDFLEGRPVLQSRVPLAFETYLTIRGEVEALPDAERDVVYASAAQRVGGDFLNKFDESRGQGSSAGEAFSRARIAHSMRHGLPPAEFPQVVVDALREALRDHRGGRRGQ